MDFQTMRKQLYQRKRDIYLQIAEKTSKIERTQKEIEELKQLYEKEKMEQRETLRILFQQKYGEEFQKVLVEYCLFVLHPKRCNFTFGHRIQMPIVVYDKQGLQGYFSYVKFSKSKHGIHWGHIEGYSGVTLIKPSYYQECIPTQKIKEAYECIGIAGELISSSGETISHGN
jgi:hypothetical protein